MFIRMNRIILGALCAMNIAGCATSNVLTHVPQDPIWQAQMHPIKQIHKPRISPEEIQHEFLANYSPLIQKAFLQYQQTGKAPTFKLADTILIPYNEDKQRQIICEPSFYICDIALEPGEIFDNVRGGDTARWIYNEVTSGEGDTSQPHVLFRPKFSDISTDAVITTNKRTYLLRLLSRRDNFVKEAKFYYPEEMQSELQQLTAKLTAEQKQAETVIMPSVPEVDPALWDHEYRITRACCSANPAWMPIEAFNDGTHVYIEMPPQIRVTDAPVLFIRARDGSQQLVNYRVKNNYYIVDTLFKQAYMISGVGRAQEKVLITYKG